MNSKNCESLCDNGASTMDYPILRSKPVARFKYKGNHSKPIRREVILTQVTRDLVTGYEVREGNETRSLDQAVIKSFHRSKIVDFERWSLSDSTIIE